MARVTGARTRRSGHRSNGRGGAAPVWAALGSGDKRHIIWDGAHAADSVGIEHQRNVGGDPLSRRSLAVHGPVHEGTHGQGLNRPRQVMRIAGSELAGVDRVVEQRVVSGGGPLRVLEGDLVEIGIAGLELQKRELVGEFLGRVDIGDGVAGSFEECVERGQVGLARQLEAAIDSCCAVIGQGEQQPAFGSEALDQRGGREPDLAGDIGECEPRGPDPRDGAACPLEDVAIGS